MGKILISLNLLFVINLICCEDGVTHRQVVSSHHNGQPSENYEHVNATTDSENSDNDYQYSNATSDSQNSDIDYEYFNATIDSHNSDIDYQYYNATIDSQNLYNAIAGLGTTEDVIISILTSRTNKQIQLIRAAYKDMFERNLVNDLKGDLSGNFWNLVRAVVLVPEYHMAKELRKYLISFVLDDFPIVEILCTKHKTELIKILNAYENQFNKTLKSDIDEFLEGDLKKFLKYILSEKFRGIDDADPTKANSQLESIPNVKDFCSIEENGNLSTLLGKESFKQIALVEIMYEKQKERTIIDELEKWCTKDDLLRDAYITIVRFAMDPIRYYAQELHQAMIGLGTNDEKLIRIIVGRSEIDLFNIKKKYEELYKKTLVSSVEADTSGYYRKMLVRMIQQSDYTGVSDVTRKNEENKD